jgi:hypothetical protein
MSKSSTSKQSGAKKPGSQRTSRTASRSRAAKKRIRRVIFKADEWYEGAALSIGIAGRAKASRSMPLFMPRAQDKVD